MLGTILIIILILMLLGGISTPVRENYGYWPSGGLGLILIILIILILLGHL